MWFVTRIQIDYQFLLVFEGEFERLVTFINLLLLKKECFEWFIFITFLISQQKKKLFFWYSIIMFCFVFFLYFVSYTLICFSRSVNSFFFASTQIVAQTISVYGRDGTCFVFVFVFVLTQFFFCVRIVLPTFLFCFNCK